MKKALFKTLLVSLLSLFPTIALGQEQYVSACAQRPACQLDSGVSWNAPTRTYVFTPMAPNVSLRIWIHNNNPTSAHNAQTIKGFVTDSTQVTSLVTQADQWAQIAITDNSVTNAKCASVAANNPSGAPGANGKGTCYTVGMYAAQIAIQFTPGGTQAGSPDTFDIGLVQQVSNYPGGPQPGEDSSATGTIVQPLQWTITNNPATGSAATATRAACGANCRHVLDCISFGAGSNGAVTATLQQIQIVDNATIVWAIVDPIVSAAAAGAVVVQAFGLCGLEIPGSLNVTMSCQFSQGAANASEAISCTGHDVQQ